MKTLLILLASISIVLMGCERTPDEVRSEENAKARAEKNMAAHEKRNQ